MVEQEGHQYYDDDVGRLQADVGHNTAHDSTRGKAYIGGHVDPHGARGGFGDGTHVGQFLAGEPAGADADVLQEGDKRQVQKNSKNSRK